jgi:hypothetical protein
MFLQQIKLKNMKLIYIIPLLLILLLSCSNENGTTNEVKKIEVGWFLN